MHTLFNVVFHIKLYTALCARSRVLNSVPVGTTASAEGLCAAVRS